VKRPTIFASWIKFANMSVLTIRLKAARLRAGISQEKLGIEAGLDEMSASTRMNRYELGKRIPDLALVERFGEVLNVPTSYFYAKSDEEAQLLLVFHQLDKGGRERVMDLIEGLVEPRKR
jgi:transcriptional regulator with XRE-family HTH domain